LTIVARLVVAEIDELINKLGLYELADFVT
jgi:hypothetical protein